MHKDKNVRVNRESKEGKIVFNNRDDLIKIGEALSQQFERLYEERVYHIF